jgi:Ribbon-helix-helix protein, copG family
LTGRVCTGRLPPEPLRLPPPPTSAEVVHEGNHGDTPNGDGVHGSAARGVPPVLGERAGEWASDGDGHGGDRGRKRVEPVVPTIGLGGPRWLGHGSIELEAADVAEGSRSLRVRAAEHLAPGWWSEGEHNPSSLESMDVGSVLKLLEPECVLQPRPRCQYGWGEPPRARVLGTRRALCLRERAGHSRCYTWESMASKQVNVRLGDSDRERLARLAAARGLSKSDTIRRVLLEADAPEPEPLRLVPSTKAEPVDDAQRIEAELVANVMAASEHDWRASRWLLEQRWPERWARGE